MKRVERIHNFNFLIQNLTIVQSQCIFFKWYDTYFSIEFGKYHSQFANFFQILNFDKGCDTVDEHYCSFSSNIHELLVGHSKINHNDVCLSYVFTYQHLADSTLGLAWSGNSKIGNEIICN